MGRLRDYKLDLLRQRNALFVRRAADHIVRDVVGEMALQLW